METRNGKRLREYCESDLAGTGIECIYFQPLQFAEIILVIYDGNFLLDLDLTDTATSTHQTTKKPKKIPKIFDGKFFVIESNQDDNIKARCTQCNEVKSGQISSTGNFIKHYQSKHPLKLNELRDSNKKPNLLEKGTTSHQPTLNEMARVLKSDEVNELEIEYVDIII